MRHTLLPPSTAVSYSPSAYNLRRNRKVGATLHLPSLLHLFLFLLLCSLLCRIPQARAADILDFNDDNGLPSCAHGCTDLYSAQYECQDQSDHEAMIKCFCESGFTHRKDREWDCGTACTRPEDKGRLKGWVNGVCRSVEMASSTRTIKESATPSPTEEVDKEKDQPKAKESW